MLTTDQSLVYLFFPWPLIFLQVRPCFVMWQDSIPRVTTKASRPMFKFFALLSLHSTGQSKSQGQPDSRGREETCQWEENPNHFEEGGAHRDRRNCCSQLYKQCIPGPCWPPDQSRGLQEPTEEKMAKYCSRSFLSECRAHRKVLPQ